MLKMKQRNRKEISDLTMDLEVINPIESKTLLGGEWYDTPDPLNGGWLNNVNVGGGSSSGGGYDTWGGIVDYSSDWNNYGGDAGGGGGGGGDTILTVDDYPGENLTTAERSWLAEHVIYLPSMIHNKSLAEAEGKGQHNGIFDALRHALWSALDAYDIGAQDAYDFHSLHETEHWNSIESPSDLINNGWGYNWTLGNGDPENNMNQFITDFNHAVANGQISIIPQ